MKILIIIFSCLLFSCSIFKNNTSDSSMPINNQNTPTMHETKVTSLNQLITETNTLRLVKEKNVEYIKIEKSTDTETLMGLLSILWEEKMEIGFFDAITNKNGEDPGAYFSYSTRTSNDDKTWAMIYGNHGWSGGIYHISTEDSTKSNLVRASGSVGQISSRQSATTSYHHC